VNCRTDSKVSLETELNGRTDLRRSRRISSTLIASRLGEGAGALGGGLGSSVKVTRGGGSSKVGELGGVGVSPQITRVGEGEREEGGVVEAIRREALRNRGYGSTKAWEAVAGRLVCGGCFWVAVFMESVIHLLSNV